MFKMKVGYLFWIGFLFAVGSAYAESVHVRMARIPDGDISRLRGRLPLPAKTMRRHVASFR